MKRFAWVTDSTASFNERERTWLEENHVYVVPMGLSFGETTYREGIDITIEEFYIKMEESTISPMSSQPSFGDFISLYEKLKEDYDEAVVIHASGHLTGAYASSIQAAEIVGFPIQSVDSWLGSFPLKFMIETAITLHQNGMETHQLIQTLRAMREKCRLFLLPSSLEQLRKSGKVSNFSSIVGNLLQIKPILALKEGKVSIIEKVRTSKKAEASLLSLLSHSVDNGIHSRVAVLYAGGKEGAQGLLTKIKDNFKDLNVEMMPLIPVAGVHTGVGTLGIAWVEK
jgi:DegV family protein with EDD domain